MVVVGVIVVGVVVMSDVGGWVLVLVVMVLVSGWWTTWGIDGVNISICVFVVGVVWMVWNVLDDLRCCLTCLAVFQEPYMTHITYAVLFCIVVCPVWSSSQPCCHTLHNTTPSSPM